MRFDCRRLAALLRIGLGFFRRLLCALLRSFALVSEPSFEVLWHAVPIVVVPCSPILWQHGAILPVLWLEFPVPVVETRVGPSSAVLRCGAEILQAPSGATPGRVAGLRVALC